MRLRLLQGKLFIQVLLAVTLVGMFVVPAVADQVAELQNEISTLKQGQEKILEELAALKKLVQESPRAAPAAPGFKPKDLTLGDAHTLGAAAAPVTLFSYSDFHCPYCRRHATTVMNSLISEYVDDGSLRIVLREYPIPTLHPRATAAAKVAVCAGAQGQYQAMHDLLFSDQKATSDETFAAYATQLGLDPEDFQACVDSLETAARVRADIAEGQGLGVTGTPSFVIGLSDQDNPDKVRVTRFIRGAQPLSAFNNAIEEQLKKLEAAR